jgi:PAS domain S-box-containing protein
MDDLICPEDLKIMRNRLEDRFLGSQSPTPIETKLIKKDGSTFSIEGVSTRTTWQGQVVGMGIFRDISGQKQFEYDLKESKENFKKLFDHVNDGIIMADIHGKHIYVNNSFAEMTGYSVPELLEKSMADLIIPEDQEELGKQLKDRITGVNIPYPYQTSFIKKDGAIINVEGISFRTTWEGQVVAMGINREVNEHKLAENVLQQNDETSKTPI